MNGERRGPMAELLRANILANFAYYRRSSLLLAFMLVFLLLTGLSSLPPLFMHSGVQSFDTLRHIFSVLNGFLLFFAGGLGLFIISSHLRSRSLKMVFTKPCSPALWLVSAFLSAVAVSLLLNSIVLGCAAALSLGWHLPVRAGLLFVSVDTFVASVGIIAYLMLLATLVHPAIAVTLALIFNAGLFLEFQQWAQVVIRSGNSSLALRALERLFHYIYLLIPMVYAFGKKTEPIYSSLRVVHSDWKYLLYSFGYVVVLAAFCYSLALFALQRKRHI
jgi:ABC-type transport system involved in multi-copper enzyme maturation permease subunit